MHFTSESIVSKIRFDSGRKVGFTVRYMYLKCAHPMAKVHARCVRYLLIYCKTQAISRWNKIPKWIACAVTMDLKINNVRAE